MKTILSDSATILDLNGLPLKNNLLRRSGNPKIVNANGEEFEPKTGYMKEPAANRIMCNRHHVQLHSKLPFTVTYRIADKSPIEKLLVSTFSASSIDFGYGRYEIYLSNDEESLYNAENKVGEYDRRGVFTSADVYKGTAQIFTLETPTPFEYFGIKFTHGSITDGVVRLDLAGAFAVGSAEESLALSGYGASLLENNEPEFDGDNVIFKLGNRVMTCDTLITVDKNQIVEGSLDGKNYSPLSLDFAPKKIGDKDYYISRNPFKAIAIRSKVGNIIGAFSDKTVVTVLPDETVNKDFLGIGTNVLPFQLMDESVKKYGYDPAFIELEHNAIKQLDLKIIRVWFQNDWFQLGPDQYDFEQEKMQQFYKYMDIFLQLQTEIELDFSFAVGSKLHSWYTIPEMKDQGRSAPRDVNQFARSVAACLKYLTEEKGYNVRYLTISNEPENYNFAVTNEADADRSIKKAYYAKTLIAIDKELREAGIRDRFEIWAAEDSAYMNNMDWLYDMHRLAGGVIDRYTKHSYVAYNDELLNEKIPFYKKSTDGAPVCLTEFGCHVATFEQSTIGNAIAAANGGLDTALHWCLTNSVLPDPFSSPFDEDICLYRNDNFKNDGLFIESICAEIGPAMRYVPAHCRVVKSLCSNENDLRVATFEKDGDYTVVVETNCSGERDLVINLGEITDKPFYGICYDIGKRERPDCIMPQLEPISLTDQNLKIRLKNTHNMYLFTTIK